jgi:hypothetical protein
VVAGSPRSGTTWLAELLRELPRYKFLNEPLYLPNSPEARAANFGWRTVLSPEVEDPQAQAFFSDVLSGRVPHGPRWHYRADSPFGRLWEQATRDRLVVKFCRAGRLLHWLCNRFVVRGTVMIIRHPCAVLASQLEHGGWDAEHLDHPVESSDAFGQVPPEVRERFSGIFDGVTTRLEVMATVWCLDYYLPLVEHSHGENPWHLVTYERLVLDGRSEMKRVLSSVGAEMTGPIHEQLDEAATYASEDLALRDKQRQLSKWQDRLTQQQVDRVLEIVSAFGLDFYTEDLEPDHGALDRY